MTLKKFEDYTTINAKGLIGGHNWSPSYHVNKAKGKTPYTKSTGGILIEVDPKKSIPKDALYLTPEQVENYNNITQKIIDLNNERDQLLMSREEAIKEGLLTIVDLAHKIAEEGHDFEAIRHILSNDFKYEGDEGVINAAKELGFRIEAMGKGRYILK
jgi:hypothetical protein